ncbi:MAG: hypothetical protein WC236_07080 [Gallionellaceae bacterium]
MKNNLNLYPPAFAIAFISTSLFLLAGCSPGQPTKKTNESNPPSSPPPPSPPVVVSANLMGGAIQGTALSLTNSVTTLAGSGSPGALDTTGLSATFNLPSDITTDGNNLYLADNWNHKIRRINISTGATSTLAGSGAQGSMDATATAASFNYPSGITNDGINIYIADTYNHKIRKITLPTGVVTTLAGSGVSGYLDGTGSSSQFNLPTGITTDNFNLYISDNANHRIRKIVLSTGVVSTFAGSGNPGFLDATGTMAQFDSPQGLTTDGTYLYVADNGNNRIRKVELGTGIVSTLAGSGSSGAADGTGIIGASFNSPGNLTTDGTNLFVTDNGNHRIRKVVIASTVVSTVAGSGQGSTDAIGQVASFKLPKGIITDGSKLFIADTGNHKIRKIQ